MNRLTASCAILLFAATSAVAAGQASINASAVTAGTYTVEPTHTRVQFTVWHMGFTHWWGDFTGASGSLSLDTRNVAASRVDISIPVASVSTTNTQLDSELRSADWFDAARFPTIHFVSTRVVRTGPATASIRGNLTLHGVTRPVSLAATFNGAGVNSLNRHYTVGFDAVTTIRRSDFGVTKYVPVVGDETMLRISAAFERAN